MKIFLALICLPFVLWSCQSETSQSQEPGQTTTETTEMGPTQFVVNIDRLRMRDTPGEEGTVIKELEKGTILYDQGEVSDFTTRIKLRGITFDEPWLKVIAPDQTVGWIYAGAIHLGTSPDSKLAKLLREKRLVTLFGPDGAAQLTAYRNHFHQANEAKALLDAYREGRQFRDQFVDLLEEKISVGETEETQPDLFWLEEAMPGFIPQLVAEGTVYYLFEDYRQWIKKAKETDNPLDDQFVELKIKAFPTDSIEYFFAAWQIQTWDYGGSSLLGRGIHLAILKAAEALIQSGHYMDSEIRQVKTQIVDDILQPTNSFWESKEKVIAEMDNMLQANLTIIDKKDKIALEARRQQFDAPESHQIEMNVRAGN
ncbi:MAG: SH3 domain-containing protein [Saprospiraceae bacterium]